MARYLTSQSECARLVEQSEGVIGVEVEVALGDAAYGSSETWRQFIDANRTLIAKVPGTARICPTS